MVPSKFIRNGSRDRCDLLIRQARHVGSKTIELQRLSPKARIEWMFIDELYPVDSPFAICVPEEPGERKRRLVVDDQNLIVLVQDIGVSGASVGVVDQYIEGNNFR